MLAMRNAGVLEFEALPESIPPLAWPTNSRALFADPTRYVARTRANPNYGLPGWTRDCGRRFHRGLDIAPTRVRSAGYSVTVQFSDCATGREYESLEPASVPEDEVFSVLPGRVVEVNGDPEASDLGCFVALEHVQGFFTLYAHLASVDVVAGREVDAGVRLGPMGQTSRSADARAWMAIAPHLHFEVIAGDGGAHNPLEFLRRGLA